jgi:hypothetical protein
MVDFEVGKYHTENNVHIFDEPYVVDYDKWMKATSQLFCILNDDFDLMDETLTVLAFVDKEEDNRFICSYFSSLSEEEKKKWVLFRCSYGGGGLAPIY